VSTTIREDGSRINTHNMGQNQSEKARKELEVLFGLTWAEQQKKSFGTFLNPLNPVPVNYGKAETKQSISEVVRTVFHHYAFSSLPEYNAALRPFNVLADRGREDGRIYKPTLDNLQWQFAAGEKKKQAHRETLKEKIDRCFWTTSTSLEEVLDALKKKGVFTLPRRNGEGRLYGITFVDHETKCVFNGSDLGKEYSARAIQARLAAAIPESRSIEKREESKTVLPQDRQKVIAVKEEARLVPNGTFMNLLLASNSVLENVPFPLLKKKKRRKKRTPGM
jgi:hypothetical protein